MIRLHLLTYGLVSLRLAVGRCGGFLGGFGFLVGSIHVAAGAAKRARSAAKGGKRACVAAKRRSAQEVPPMAASAHFNPVHCGFV